MRIVCISDIHNRHNDLALPDGDCLVVAGDMTNRGTLDELMAFTPWLRRQPHKHKVVIAGNHDWCFQRDPAAVMLIRGAGAHYLQDEAVELDGLKFFGSPWQPEFCGWAFNLPRGHQLRAKWAGIPQDTQVLVTHGPPYGVLDQCPSGDHVGCRDLRTRLWGGSWDVGLLDAKLRLHVFGHVHHSAGMTGFAPATFVNAAVCDERYAPVNPIQVVDVCSTSSNQRLSA